MEVLMALMFVGFYGCAICNREIPPPPSTNFTARSIANWRNASAGVRRLIVYQLRLSPSTMVWFRMSDIKIVAGDVNRIGARDFFSRHATHFTRHPGEVFIPS
jgi:hypothetical protein